MSKTLKTLLTVTVSCVFIIATAGIIKFNFPDIPFDGDPATNLSANGKSLQFKLFDSQ